MVNYEDPTKIKFFIIQHSWGVVVKGEVMKNKNDARLIKVSQAIHKNTKEILKIKEVKVKIPLPGNVDILMKIL